MSNYKETDREKSIRELSIAANPYDDVCPNKQLWSEGFRAGVQYMERRTEYAKQIQRIAEKNGIKIGECPKCKLLGASAPCQECYDLFTLTSTDQHEGK